MTTHTPRRTGRPPKTPPAPAVEELLIAQLRKADDQIRESTRERARIAMVANEAGITNKRIGEAIGASEATVSNWVRAARTQTPDSA